jgi:ectoine hydroxylase-related dioxygenase (phytanoyl-CoA dioxygenase family)
VTHLLGKARAGALYLCAGGALAGAAFILSPAQMNKSLASVSDDAPAAQATADASRLNDRGRSSTREGVLMSESPLVSDTGMLSQAAAANPAKARAAVRVSGLCRVNGVLSDGVVDTLLAHVNGVLADACSRIAVDEKDFAPVLSPSQRWDLKLALTPPVIAALSQALGPLKDVCGELLGSEAVLFECAALVSDPQAPRQPVHPDTAYHLHQGPAVLTVFIALQDVHENMGPTIFLPCTHTREAHAAFNDPSEASGKEALLSRSPKQLGLLDSGDAIIFDSRLLHCGSANESEARRVIFYFSFKAEEARAPPGTLDAELQRQQLRLSSSSDWLHDSF